MITLCKIEVGLTLLTKVNNAWTLWSAYPFHPELVFPAKPFSDLKLMFNKEQFPIINQSYPSQGCVAKLYSKNLQGKYITYIIIYNTSCFHMITNISSCDLCFKYLFLMHRVKVKSVTRPHKMITLNCFK